MERGNLVDDYCTRNAYLQQRKGTGCPVLFSGVENRLSAGRK